MLFDATALLQRRQLINISFLISYFSITGCSAGAVAYLEPVGDLEVDFVDALHPVVERLHGLAGLQNSLCEGRRKGQLVSPLRFFQQLERGRLKDILRDGSCSLTSMAGYSVLAVSSMVSGDCLSD